MFDKDKYITQGINEIISLELQIFMWQLIENMQIEKDYLQVFEFTREMINGKSILKIIHSQEIPYYKKEYTIQVDFPIDEKIIVIDDLHHCTMLLANEY